MKGIIFNLLEAVVTNRHGEQVWDQALETSGVSGAYTSVGRYSDEEFIELLQAVGTEQDLGTDDLLGWFGRHAMPLLAQKYPSFFEGPADIFEFLLTINDIIHPEVRKLYPDADVPVFDFTSVPGRPEALRVGYDSHRRLCRLADGFMRGAADVLDADLSIRHELCVHRGDDRCQMLCTTDSAIITTPA